ncbi:MAG: winged helix-turn-helix transcriptional regulator [Candidatus Thermoplasmatota archaeon]|nr:winged helix-turn-helix transcriptional regulator [Candidatus Thermoplasmatota archaeon]
MPLHSCSSPQRLHSVVLFLIASSFLLSVLSSIPVYASSSTVLYDDDSFRSLQISIPASSMNYTTILADTTPSNTTVVIDGTVKRIVELAEDSVAVQLPDDRLAIKSTEETSLLPQGSTLTYIEEKPFITLPEQSEVLEVASVVVSPLKNFTTNTHYMQSVQEFNEYIVQLVFFELARQSADVALVNYVISWGDGIQETYPADAMMVSHDYERSGSYTITVIVSDELGFTYVSSHPYTVAYEGHATHAYLFVKTNRGPVGFVSISVGLLGFGLLAFTESGRYKFLALLTLLMPFYTRLSKEDVLDQFVRGQIYGFIKTNPGAHYNQIRRQIGVKNGTLSYHLNVLEKTELIQSRREGLKYRAFYPSGMTFPKRERFRLTELQIRILDALRQHPGLTQKELAGMLGQKPQTINYNIKVLDQAGLLDVEKKGRHTCCYPVPDAPESVGE